MATITPTAEPLVIHDGQVEHVSPEGKSYQLPLGELVQAAADRFVSRGTPILPKAVRAVKQLGNHTVWLAEFEPAVWPLKWITGNSPRPFGPGTKYEPRSLALPYLVIFAVFEGSMLSGSNECFFRNAPLRDWSDELFYPALLNVSKFNPPEGRSLAWICTQYLNRNVIAAEKDETQRMRVGFEQLFQVLLQDGFNHSSEHHEGQSWHGESKRVDPRLETVEKWEAASKADALFPLSVSWLPTGLNCNQVVERIFKNLNAVLPALDTSAVVRLLVNHKPRKPR